MRVLVRLLKVLLPLIVLGVAVLAAMTMIRNRPEVETQAPVIPPPGVRAHMVALETVRISVASQGTVRPRTETQLVPEIAGRVNWVSPSFVEGGFFEEGDVLLRLDRFDYEQAVVSARSQLAQARLRLAQEEAEAEVAQREWETLGLGDPRELTLRKPQLEDARASVAAAEANVERAERDLERADVVAPYAGRVRTKSVDVGQFVTVGAPIARVYAVDIAEIRLPLPDEELAYLDLPLAYRGATNQAGPRVVLGATFAGDRYEWGGRIVRTESEIDPVSRMVHVVAEVQDPYAPGPNPNRPPLAVGMYVEAEIEGQAFRDIAVVPRAALRGSSQVLVIDGEDRIRFREVEVLRTTTESVYVSSGLADGELLAVSALDSPTDGMVVQVTNVDGTLRADASVPAEAAPPAARATPTETVRPEAVTDTRVAEVAPEPPSSDQPGWLRELLAETPAPRSRADRREPAATPRPASRPDEDRVTRTTPAPAPPPAPAREAAATNTAAPSAGDARPEATPSPAAGRSVAILPFEELNRTEDSDLGAALMASVATRLENEPSITVVPSASDAGWIVGGGIQRLGDVVRVTARVVDREDGGVVEAIKVDGTVSDLARVRQEVAAAIGASLADSIGGRPGAAAPTGPALAIRGFSNVSQQAADGALVDAIVSAVTEQLASLSAITIVADETEATWVVTGGVQRVGNIVRITANLVDTREGSVLRAVKVDGLADQLGRLQEQVASELSDSVREATS